jgi:hypothetical protein
MRRIVSMVAVGIVVVVMEALSAGVALATPVPGNVPFDSCCPPGRHGINPPCYPRFVTDVPVAQQANAEPAGIEVACNQI